jgi:hypothetical protein
MSPNPRRLLPPLARDVAPAQVVTLTLDESWPPSGLGPARDLLDQIPHPTSLPRGAWVAVLAAEPHQGRGLGRLLRRPSPPGAHLAARCTALLLRGYANTCADAEGTAFGQVP